MTGDEPRVVVIGAGQAGLWVSHLLREKTIDHVVLERSKVGASWRGGRWDSFRLVTPNWLCKLPGEGCANLDPDGFMTHRQVERRLEQLAEAAGLPIRLGVSVTAVVPRRGGGYRVDTDAGALTCQQVVIATGSYHEPLRPVLSTRLDRELTQLHSSEYRCPNALPEGGALVVGSGQSGWQIARELHCAGRAVHWSLGRAAWLPRCYRGRDIFRWLEALGVLTIPVEDHPGGPLVRQEPKPFFCDARKDDVVDPRRLAQEGLVVHGRMAGAEGRDLSFASDGTRRLREADDACLGMVTLIDTFIESKGLDAPQNGPLVTPFEPTEPDLRLNLGDEGISTVIWATGYRSNWHRWIGADVFDDRGYPCAPRGITRAPGLFFVGADWMHTWGSGLLYGVAADAAHVVEHLAAHG